MKTIFAQKKWVGYLCIMLVVLALFGTKLLYSVDVKLQDRLFKDQGLKEPAIAVIGIDQKSLSKLGPFQYWTRQTMADAIRILNRDPENKPAVIGLDVVYTGASNDKAADDALAKAAAEGGNVVAAAMATYGDTLAGGSGNNLFAKKAVIEYETPYEALEKSCHVGFVNTTLDKDGVVRYAYPSLTFQGQTMDSFSRVILEQYLQKKSLPIPVDKDNRFYISYTCEPDEYYGGDGAGNSFSDIFDPDFDPALFADSIVLIGPFASGLMDSYFTPMNPQTPMNGVEIHANIIQMILEENYKSAVPDWVQALILLLVLALCIGLFHVLDIRVSLGILVLFVAADLFLTRLLFQHGYILSILYTLLAVVLLYVYEVAYGYITERMEKQKIKDTFKKYVDPKLVDKLIISGEANSNAVGTKRHIAVLFVDVRGFTPMAEALKDQPETVVKILNDYLELTSSAVFDNGGSVDKFIGDATMALFNGFVPLDDYVFKAVKAAWDIVQGSTAVNASILEKYGVNVGFGVGVNCGEAIVGNLGPSFRKDYTAIGDTVNTSARLESNAKAAQVLISKEVRDQLDGRINTISLGEITMKGKEPMEIFELTGIINL